MPLKLVDGPSILKFICLRLGQIHRISQWQPNPDCKCEILIRTSILLIRPVFSKPTDTFCPDLQDRIKNTFNAISVTHNKYPKDSQPIVLYLSVPSFLSSSNKFWNSEWKISRCFSIRTFSQTRAR